MGRAIVREPSAFLMDEPLSNLDAKLRVQMRAEIARIQKRLGTTTLYVTHDQVEAMTMADRVATMSRGLVQQVASPADLYAHPTNLFVAGFIGSPPMSLFDGVVVRDDGALGVRFGSQWLELPASEALTSWEGRAVVIGIRPEDVEDAAFDTAAPQTRRLRLAVDLVEQLGSDVLVHLLTDAVAAQGAQLKDAAEDAAQIATPTAGARLLARCNPRCRIARGDVAEFTVDTERVHLFDPVSGNAL